MRTILALLALLPTLAFGATSTSTCIPDVLAITGGDIVVFDVTADTAACAVQAARLDPQRVYLVSSDLRVTQILSVMLPDSGRVLAVGPAMNAAGLVAELNTALAVVLHELDDDEEDDETSDPMLLNVHAVIAAMARNYGWRVL